jgi:hypothetical protein
MAQVVEHLPSNFKALTSNSSTRRKEGRKEGGREGGRERGKMDNWG